MPKIGGRVEGLNQSASTNRIDADLRSKIGNFKYNAASNWTPVKLIGESEFKPCPDVDPKKKKPKVGLINDELTWLKAKHTVDFMGFVFVDDEGRVVRKQVGFWLLPDFHSMKQYIPELGKSDLSQTQKVELAGQKAPYSILWNALNNIQGSLRATDAPKEWRAITDGNYWQNWVVRDVLGIKDAQGKGVYGCPIPKHEEHVLVRCYLTSVKDKDSSDAEDFSTKTYLDNSRSDGSVHPVLGEFSKSATNNIVKLVEEEGELTGEMGEVGNDTIIQVKKIKGQQGGTRFQLKIRGAKDPIIEADEVVREWAPLRKPVTIDGVERKPILNVMTVEHQIELMEHALGPELVSFAFENTAYHDALSSVAKGAFDELVNSGDNWLQRTIDRVLAQSKRDKVSKTAEKNKPQDGKKSATISKTSNDVEDESEDEGSEENEVDLNADEDVSGEPEDGGEVEEESEGSKGEYDGSNLADELEGSVGDGGPDLDNFANDEENELEEPF